MEVVVDNPQVMHAFQAPSHPNQLSLRGIRGSITGRRCAGSGYQFQRSHVGLIPQVLLEVLALHIHIDETEGMSLSRVNSHEGYHVHISTVKEVMHVYLIAEPLCDVSGVPLGIGYG